MKKRHYSSGYHAFKSYKRYLRKRARLMTAGLSSGDKLDFLNKRIEKLKLFLSALLKKSKMATAAGTLVLALSSNSANSQTFLDPVQNPYGISIPGSYLQAPAFADLDGDGDLDMMVGDFYGSFTYFENTGSSTAPAFGPAQANQFGLSSLGFGSRPTPTFCDLDNDGDFDMMVGTNLGYGDIYYYENTGDVNSPTFAAPVANGFGIVVPTYTYTYYAYTYTYALAENPDPALVDIDGDGDLDMYVGNYTSGDIYYYENTGDASSPVFAAPVVGLNVPTNSNTPDFADIDGDGDFDLFFGTYYGTVSYCENTGNASAPTFAVPIVNAFTGLVDIGYTANIEIADLDGDGDLDIMVGELYDNVYYFEQCTAPLEPTNDTPVADLSICIGESTTLLATGLGTLGWYDAPTGGNYLGGGGSLTTGFLAGDTTFYVQDSTCANGPRLAIDVTASPTPNVATSLTGITISADMVGATYQWVTCPSYTNASGVSTNQSYTPSANGQYAVIVNNNGCADTSSCTTISTVGLEDELLNNLVLYPNPTDGNFTIDLGQSYDQIMIQITNSLGQVVENSVYTDLQLIDIQLDSESGIYFVEIITSEGLRSKVKLIVK